MMNDRHLVAVYGTLMHSRIFGEQKGKPCILQGNIYYSDTMGFPAFVPSDNPKRKVAALIYEVSLATLQELDHIEGYRELNPNSSLYLRKEVKPVWPKKAGFEVWVYVWNSPTKHMKRIKSGSWQQLIEGENAYARRRKNRKFAWEQ